MQENWILKSNEVKQNIVCDKAYSQITFDDDYVIRDNKPDVGSIVCIKGNATLDDQKVVNGSLWLTGKVNYELLYIAEDKGQAATVVNGSIPFQEKVVLDGIAEDKRAKVYTCLEEISASIINSRKVSVRGIIDVEAVLEEQNIQKLACAVDDSKVQQKVENENMLCLTGMRKDVLRIQKELQLPKSKSNIGEILFYYLDIRNKEITLVTSGFKLQGEACVCILYRTEENEEEWFDTSFSFSQDVDCPGVESADVYWARIDNITSQIDIEGDYDHEMRQLAIDMIFDVDVKAWREKELPILKDVYSITTLLEPQYDVIKSQKLLMKNIAKVRIAEEVTLDDMKDKILQVCGCKSAVKVEHTEIKGNLVLVEGVLQIDMLYIAATDQAMIGHEVCQLPFSEEIEAWGIGNNASCQIEAGVDQLQINLLDGLIYEVKATLSVGLLVMEENELRVISKIVESDGANDAISDMPGMIGYIVQEEESLWDIAKKYCTTMDELIQINNLNENQPQKGDRLLIIKSCKELAFVPK